MQACHIVGSATRSGSELASVLRGSSLSGVSHGYFSGEAFSLSFSLRYAVYVCIYYTLPTHIYTVLS